MVTSMILENLLDKKKELWTGTVAVMSSFGRRYRIHYYNRERDALEMLFPPGIPKLCLLER
jgi:hypothetical protein